MSLEALARALGIEQPEAALAALRALYQEVDQEVAARSAGLGLPCRVGCDACCRESVFLSAPEFLLVVDHLVASWPKAAMESLLFAMDQLADRFEDELELLELISPGAERDEVAARIKFDCPFLMEGACRIYAVRELNARTFGASWDVARHESYGCTLTHERLRVLPDDAGPALAGAREMRARLAARLPRTETVHVYPWWFRRHKAALQAILDARP